jgi:hypothetical protein
MFHKFTQFSPVLPTVAVVTRCGAPDERVENHECSLSDAFETAQQVGVD